jgi:hypothetical protein
MFRTLLQNGQLLYKSVRQKLLDVIARALFPGTERQDGVPEAISR